jgi:UDP-glucuronate decarboxylase
MRLMDSPVTTSRARSTSATRSSSPSLPADDPLQRKPNIEKARKILGWEPKIQLDAGLKKTIAYFDALLKTNRAISSVGAKG